MDSRDKLCELYIGISIEDLSIRNPSKSCTICYNVNCIEYGSINNTCIKFRYISPSNWIKRRIILLKEKIANDF